jgi:hypothetical protein
MIRLCGGPDVLRLLRRFSPTIHRRLFVASAYIDERHVQLLASMAAFAPIGSVQLAVPPTAAADLETLGRSARAPQILIVPSLHAKAYVLLGHDRKHHEAIVASANLTGAGTTRSRELGIHLRGSEPSLLDTIEAIPVVLTRRHIGERSDADPSHPS